MINWLQLFPYEHFNWANLLMETEIDGVEKKPFLPFHPSCIVDSCQKPYPYCDSPFLSLTWVNGLNFHYDKHTGSRGWFYLINWKMVILKIAVVSNRVTHSWAVIWSVVWYIQQSTLEARPILLSQYLAMGRAELEGFCIFGIKIATPGPWGFGNVYLSAGQQ